MTVEVERDPNLAVAQSFAGDLGVDASREHVGCVRVAEIVQPYALQAAHLQEGRERVREAIRLRWRAIGLHDDMMIRRNSDTNAQQRLRLFDTVPAQFLD